MARYHPDDWTWLAVADLDDESVSERSLEHKGMLRLTVLALACLHAAEGYVPSLSAPRAERRAAERAGLLRQPAAHMCGVLAVVNSQQSPDALRLQTLTLQRLVRHRGPDGSGIHVIEHDCPTSGNCLCSSIAPRHVDTKAERTCQCQSGPGGCVAEAGRGSRQPGARSAVRSASWSRSEPPCFPRLQAHERLAIVDPLSGNQPLFSHDNTRSLTVNGEIYNHKELRAQLKDQEAFRTASDCEVITPTLTLTLTLTPNPNPNP